MKNKDIAIAKAFIKRVKLRVPDGLVSDFKI